MPAGRVGQWESVTGVRPAYAADAAKRSQVTQAPLRRLEVAVPGREPADGALAEALERLGCTVRREACPGVPAFRTGRGGFRLLAEDEEGEPLPPEQLLTIVALIEYEDGAGRVAVPDAAPAAIDALAAGYHAALSGWAGTGRRRGTESCPGCGTPSLPPAASAPTWA